MDPNSGKIVCIDDEKDEVPKGMLKVTSREAAFLKLFPETGGVRGLAYAYFRHLSNQEQIREQDRFSAMPETERGPTVVEVWNDTYKIRGLQRFGAIPYEGTDRKLYARRERRKAKREEKRGGPPKIKAPNLPHETFTRPELLGRPKGFVDVLQFSGLLFLAAMFVILIAALVTVTGRNDRSAPEAFRSGTPYVVRTHRLNVRNSVLEEEARAATDFGYRVHSSVIANEPGGHFTRVTYERCGND